MGKKAIIVIEIDENHLVKETNELYDRLKGYKCSLKWLPEKKIPNGSDIFNDHVRGYNECIDEITGER